MEQEPLLAKSEELTSGDSIQSRQVSDVSAPTPTPQSGLQTMFEYDPSANLLRWADLRTARRLLDVDDKDCVSTVDALNELISSDADADRTAAFEGAVTNYCCEYKLRRSSGGEHWVEERGGWIGAGDNRRLISVIRSIDAQKRYDDRLAWLAQNDDLTGKLNRVHLRKALAKTLRTSKDSNTKAAYIMAGVDDIGEVNNDFGFEAADMVIFAVADRLDAVISENDSIGRVAGTKFGIVVHGCDDAQLRSLCTSMLNAVRESVIDTHRGGVSASISIGAVKLDDSVDDENVAMVRAEAALDAAKRLGKSSWSQFTEKTDVVSMRRRNSHMSDVILTALNDRRIRLAFQPIVSDINDEPKKFECLIRMQAEDGSEVPAPEFIPAAERLGLVHLLDRRVLELATNTLAVCPGIHLNVNISLETVKDFVWAEGYISHLRAKS